MTTYPQKATNAAHKTENSFLSFEFEDKIRPPIIRFGQICLLNVSFSLSSHLHPYFLRWLPPHLSPCLVTCPPIHGPDGGQLFLKWLVIWHFTALKTVTGSASFTRWSGNGLDEGTWEPNMEDDQRCQDAARAARVMSWEQPDGVPVTPRPLPWATAPLPGHHQNGFFLPPTEPDLQGSLEAGESKTSLWGLQEQNEGPICLSANCSSLERELSC